MSAMKVWIVCTVLIVCVAIEESQAVVRRSTGNAINQNKNKDEKVAEPAWEPATGPREFSVNVDDQITGASQLRHEKWNNGTVKGSYASPARDGKWLMVDYIGDENGFRITSSKEVTAAELMANSHRAKDHTAHVDISADGVAQDYTVTEDQLKKNKENNKEKQQPIKRRAMYVADAE